MERRREFIISEKVFFLREKDFKKKVQKLLRDKKKRGIKRWKEGQIQLEIKIREMETRAKEKGKVLRARDKRKF